MNIEKYYKLIFSTVIFSITIINLNAQSPSLFNYYRYHYSDSPRIVYAGKVVGINAVQYDSMYRDQYDSMYWKFLSPITKSNNPIEIRLRTGSIYSRSPYTCTILYVDSSFKIKRFLQNGTELSINLKADVVYDKLIKNAIFSLEQFQVSNFLSDTATLYSSTGWQKEHFTELFGGHQTEYLLEYKVGNLYNRISINLIYYLKFPDNQLLRRYDEIAEALTEGL
ncbi:hypothetical protein LK994_06335 [Ferruginibacter lapsinanis]|uniref:hypothetical protein n=1 Tax=Ferruginibacter lapsinanis TaxID=563172 RepID=UPI001E2C000A|nr:hypothetical protein [Ferruginibacter lapsinanis]UEG51092.1 hypothetical protein LK994_06335 [Ferruginibacter lapsinanis]